MPETRRSLIQTARAQQFAALRKAKQAGDVKPAKVCMGARHPDTGLYDALLPDGSVEPGDRRFTASLPTGAQVLGIPKAAGGWTLDEIDVSPALPVTVKTAVRTKIGYVFSKVVAGSTGLYCPTPSPGGGGGTSASFDVPPSLNTPYKPVPPGETRIVTITTQTNINFVYYGLTYVSPENQSLPYNATAPPSGVSTSGPWLVDDTFTVEASSSPSSVGTSYTGFFGQTVFNEPLISTSPVTLSQGTLLGITNNGGNPNVTIPAVAVASVLEARQTGAGGAYAVSRQSYTGYLHLSFTAPVPLPSPTNGGIPTPGGTPEDPANPQTPDPAQSLEFWYQGDKATDPVKLKSLAANQPLEATPYLLHKSNSLSYVVLKYGNAGNDGGSGDDWCKLSLFEVTGAGTLAVTETIYGWAQAATLQAALKSPFNAIVGSKAKVEKLNLPALITAGKLDARLRCLTHRNLSNFKTVGGYLIDPILLEPSPLSDLATDTLYTYGAIRSNLVALPESLVSLRFFKIVPNPAFSGVEDCLTNSAYLLKEVGSKRVKKVKVKGLASSDSTIKVLTINAGIVP